MQKWQDRWDIIYRIDKNLSVLTHNKQKGYFKKPCEIEKLRHCHSQALELHVVKDSLSQRKGDWQPSFFARRLNGNTMKCPECDFVQSDRNVRCVKCGIVLERDQARRTSILKTRNVGAEEEDVGEEGSFFQRSVFFVEPKVNLFFFGGRSLFF